MSDTRELLAVLATAQSALARGERPVLATVVGTSGSTYRRPGAKLLLTESGAFVGSISGGCLEGDLLRKAWWRTENSAAVLVTYDSRADEDDDLAWSFGLGCNGVVQVLLERLKPSGSDRVCPVSFLDQCLRERKPGVLATVCQVEAVSKQAIPTVALGERLTLNADGVSATDIRDHGLAEAVRSDADTALMKGTSTRRVYSVEETGQIEVFFDYLAVPLSFVIFGAGHDAAPLARLASEQMGWHVSVVDTRAATPAPHRFPWAQNVLVAPLETAWEQSRVDARAAAVLMTHSYEADLALLSAFARSPRPPLFLGMLGPRSRTERLLTDIRTQGIVVPETHLAVLHGPVGLDVGADGPGEIALSIVAEVQAVVRGRSGGFLRDRAAPIHTRNEVPLFGKG